MKTFKELGVRNDLIKGLHELGIINPSPIQAEVIPLLLQSNNDLIGQAQTGTGKTAAFGLPLLQRIDPNQKVVQGLILCPTRELGQQVAKQLFKFTKYSDKIFTESIYGGEKIDRQIQALKRPTHIIVATPGRLIDLIKQKAVDLSNVKTIILDEADEMLSMGFKYELNSILKMLKNVQQKWLFSATLPEGIRAIINKHLRKDALRVEMSSRNVVNTKIDHQYMICEEIEKLPTLIKILKSNKESRGLIFCKTKEATKKLIVNLKEKGFKIDGIHGDLLQKERDKAMRAFKKGTLNVLVATDIAARGIDVRGLEYVIHFQLPDKEEYYTHRAGRTARAGLSGVSLCLVSTQEMKHIRYFEKTLKIAFKQV